MDDLTTYFEELLRNHRSIEIAEIEFHRMREEDEELNQEYLDWCHEREENPKRAFRNYCEEYLSDSQEVWDHLNDYDE